MSFRGRLLLFGYPLLEIVTAYLVALAIGWGWMLLLVLIGFPVGFAIMRNAADAAVSDVVAQQASGAPAGTPAPDGSRHALAFVGGVLIAVPGFWTDLLGLLLVIPVTQRLFRARSRAWFERRFTVVRMPGVRYPAGFDSGDVIPGTVIRREDTPRPGPPPELT